MQDLYFEKPAHIKRLQWTCLFLTLISSLQIILFIFWFITIKKLPLDYFFGLRFVLLFIELWFLFLMIKIIRKNYPNVAPTIKTQYLFLLLLYFTVFSLLSEIPSFAGFIQAASFLIGFGSGGSYSASFYLALIAFFCLTIKTVLFILTIIHGFKLMKQIRINERQKNTSTQDLL